MVNLTILGELHFPVPEHRPAEKELHGLNELPNVISPVFQLRIDEVVETGAGKGRESQTAPFRLKLYPKNIRYRNRLPAKNSPGWTDFGEAF